MNILENAKNHFLGYIAVNPDTKKEYVTSDRNDPNIKIDENGKKYQKHKWKFNAKVEPI